MAQKHGLLIADEHGYYVLYTAHTEGCWHYDGPCDGSCALPGAAVQGYVPTNALLPAIVRARTLGYEDIKGAW